MRINVSAQGPVSGSETVRVPQQWSESRSETRTTTVRYRDTGDALELSMDMPGADAGSLVVTLKGRTLTVEHERKETTETVEGEQKRVERTLERLTKEVELPVEVDPARTDAVLKDGLLLLTLAKKPAEKVPLKSE